MSIFTKIMEKLGLKKKGGAPAAKTTDASKTGTAKSPSFQRTPAEASASRAGFSPKGKASDDMEMVDVVAKLEGMAAANPEKLNWKTSIVDLLKLLDIDSSLEARKEMAEELKMPAELMSDSAKMNTWLHKKVLREIADNGGNVPKELLD